MGSTEWQRLEAGFRASFTTSVSDVPRRQQNRALELPTTLPESSLNEFSNEPDTDWSLPQNGRWAEQIVARKEPGIECIPLVIDGEEMAPGSRSMRDCLDPSRPGVVLTRYVEANNLDTESAVRCAKADADGWRSTSTDQRNDILGKVAAELRRARGSLMWTAMANGGKTLAESDPEISEAVDFLELYRSTARTLFELENVSSSGRGAVVVVPPWNFPIAIPCGGIAAALAAGNTVILKPASDTVLVAWELCQCFWRAGISRKVLQFVPCAGSGAGAALVGHPSVDAVILTGGTDTARRMLAKNSKLRLFAETGGKNATIITALSDRELAVKHVAHSAFSHAGQKCSATSLLLLEREVYEDQDFKRMLSDAVRSIQVGSAWDLATRMGPLIRPPSGEVEIALKTLEAGESWAVMPHQIDNNPHLWSPGLKWGVTRGSFTHLTEFFGTVGAVVLRQPFGGMGRSCFGPGMKAGGPNYVAQFMRFENCGNPSSIEVPAHPALASLAASINGSNSVLLANERPRLLAALGSYDEAWHKEFSREHDHLCLLGQDNLRSYLPFAEIRVRVDPLDTAFDIIARVAAARVTGARVIVSTSPGTDSVIVQWLDAITDSWAAAIEFVEESDETLAAHISTLPAHAAERLRFAAPDRVPISLRATAAASGVYLADEPVLAEGRIELLWYLKEQSLSHDYHRYGNLGARSVETRHEPA